MGNYNNYNTSSDRNENVYKTVHKIKRKIEAGEELENQMIFLIN